MITTITSTGERHKSRQTRNSGQPSSSSAKRSVAPPQLCLSPHIPSSHSGRRTGVASTRSQVAVSGTFQRSRNRRRLSFGVCPYPLALLASLTLQRRVTEQPYKIPFYAALLYHLSIPTSDIKEEDGPAGFTKPSLGRLILDDFWKGFQAYLDKLAWRETRLCVRSRTTSSPHITLNSFSKTDSLLFSFDRHQPHLTSIDAWTLTVIHRSPR
jgi:hypothetical protein